jgi:hypothetical protein
MKILLFLLFTFSAAFAQMPAEEIETDVEKIACALEESEEVLAWDVVRVRTVLELGVEIPAISKFSLNPEVEFYFVKK